jgi:hypothetical protein
MGRRNSPTPGLEKGIEMNANKAIVLARKHVGNGAEMESSARFCLAEAIDASDKGFDEQAAFWACKSLTYSVGIFAGDYKAACRAVGKL